MARIVVHFGPHKTGSTALQRYFVANRHKLRDAGVIYPTEWQGLLRGHHELAFQVKRCVREGDPEGAKDLRKVMSGLANAHQVVLISSEELALLDEAELAVLADVLGGHDLEAVLFVRHWADLMPSIWQELVKQGSTANLPHFLAEVLARPLSQDVLDYQKMASRIAAAFGRDSLRLVSYDALSASGRDIAELFCGDILGVALPRTKLTRRDNESWPASRIECVRVFNVLAMTRGFVPASAWPRERFERLHAVGDASAKALESQLRPYLRSLWIPRDLAEYEAAVTRLMDAFGDRVVNPIGGRLAPPGPPSSVSYVDTDYLLDGSLVELAHEVFAKLGVPGDQIVYGSRARRVAHRLRSRFLGGRS